MISKNITDYKIVCDGCGCKIEYDSEWNKLDFIKFPDGDKEGMYYDLCPECTKVLKKILNKSTFLKNISKVIE